MTAVLAGAAAGLLSLAAALATSAWLAGSAPAAAEELAVDSSQLFTSTCAGCHVGGGNIVRRDATLRLADLQKNGIADEEGVYRTIYSGRGSMPGYGVDCAPKLQCTFGPRLSDDQIKSLAAYVLDRAQAGWEGAE